MDLCGEKLMRVIERFPWERSKAIAEEKGAF